MGKNIYEQIIMLIILLLIKMYLADKTTYIIFEQRT